MWQKVLGAAVSSYFMTTVIKHLKQTSVKQQENTVSPKVNFWKWEQQKPELTPVLQKNHRSDLKTEGNVSLMQHHSTCWNFKSTSEWCVQMTWRNRPFYSKGLHCTRSYRHTLMHCWWSASVFSYAIQLHHRSKICCYNSTDNEMMKVKSVDWAGRQHKTMMCGSESK
jgi:hypothetical protein